MAPGLSDIDWDAPWLAPWRGRGEPVARQVGQGKAVWQALAEVPSPVRFVPHTDLPPGQAYEDYIFHSKQCPTREGLHDFFNGLCWQTFPQAKLRLNQLQAAEIARSGVGGIRGPVRDAITLLDENGACLYAPDTLWQALVDRQWGRLFGELRPQWRQAQLLLFGHALLEKLVQPYKSITAHVWRMGTPLTSLAAVDTHLAGMFEPSWLAHKPFVPLPVLGVPGWWLPNEESHFYDDATVFRPRRINPLQK